MKQARYIVLFFVWCITFSFSNMPLDLKVLSKRHLRRKAAINTRKVLLSITENTCSASEHLAKLQLHHANINENESSTEEYTYAINDNYSTNYINESNESNKGSSHEENSNVDRDCIDLEYVVSDLASDDSTLHGSESNLTSDSNEDCSDLENNFVQNLRNWAYSNNITHNAIDQLLALLKPAHSILPLSARTLLRTPRCIEKLNLDTGEMCYFGLEKCLKQKLESGLKNEKEPVHTLQIDFNIDGVPVFKSSGTSFWPILGRSISMVDDSPFVIAVFYGTGKPMPLSLYLRDLIQETSRLRTDGFEYNGTKYFVRVRLFACDAPARSMLKMCLGHSGKDACERCNVRAIRINRRLCYPIGTEFQKRKDNDFISPNENDRHVKGRSPLLDLCIGLISQFPLDPMHLIYLGILKRLLLKYWVEGSRDSKLSKEILLEIERIIKRLARYVPAEFPRKPRGFLELRRWKATEFRFFVLYSGPVIMRDVLDRKKYNHFLLLSAAVYILSNAALVSRFRNIAKNMIKKFITRGAKIYGPHFIVYNVHSLLHVIDDVERFGPLEEYSCFVYENHLGHLKQLIRSKRSPLEQLSNRLEELNSIRKISRHKKCIPKPKFIGDSRECQTLETDRFKISIKRPDNVVACGNEILVIKSIVCIGGEYKIIVVEFLVGEERECALVPVLWLIENNTKCYWPRTKTEDHFTKLVKSKAAYDETWPKFAVHKVLHTCEDLNDAEVIMTRFLELGTSDESGIIHNMTKKSTVVVQKDVANDAEENVTANRKHIDVEPEQQRKKRKHKSNKSYQSDNSDNSDKKKSKKRHVSKKKKKTKLRRENSSISNYTSSSDDENVPPPKNNQSNLNRNNDITSANRFSADDTPKRKSANRITHHSIDDEIYNSSNHLSGDETPKRKSANRTRHHPNIDDTYDSTNQFSGNGTPNRNVTNRIVRSTTQYDLSKSGLLSDPSTLTPSRKQNTFEEKTLRYLEHIKSYVDQNHLLLRKIFSKQKEVTVEITKKPVEFPKLPLNSMQEFSKLEELLKSEQHRTYLTQKLASIGGTNSRQCVLAMMRVLLTNELAMQFNWAGRDKVPFQKTSTMETVYEAVKQTFLGKQEIGNVTETSVSCAVKDWLKLARSRHTYVPKRR